MAMYTMTIHEMMNNPMTPVFPDSYPFYTDNPDDKKAFEELFVMHFLTREIGFETPWLFNQKLKAKLYEIMPYYEQLYQTEWKNVRTAEAMMTSKNLTETTEHTQEVSGNNQTTSETESTSSVNDTSSSSVTQSTTSTNNGKVSNIADGVSQTSLSDGYLTGASQTTQNDNGESSSQSNNVQTATGTTGQTVSGTSGQTLTETTTFTSKGDVGIQTPAYAITEWRKVIININQLILNECEDLFMKIY